MDGLKIAACQRCPDFADVGGPVGEKTRYERGDLRVHRV